MYPIQHLSYSALRLYLTDKRAFHKTYIRKEYDLTQSPALLEGSVFHKMLEEYTTREEITEEIILKQLNKEITDEVNWGKTGSLEKSVNIVSQCLDFFFEEYEGDYENYQNEVSFMQDIGLSVPFKGRVDRIGFRENKTVEIIDWKLVSSITENDEYSTDYILQSVPYFLLAEKALGMEVTDMNFIQIKKSKNKDKSKQLSVYNVPRDLARKHEQGFLNLCQKMLTELETENDFLPNPFAQFTGEESWSQYIASLNS
jgi:hypothetical protein